jgi:hypothetical protein
MAVAILYGILFGWTISLILFLQEGTVTMSNVFEMAAQYLIFYFILTIS